MSRLNCHITPSRDYEYFLAFLKDLMTNRKECIFSESLLFRGDLIADVFSREFLPDGTAVQESYKWIHLNLETRKQLSNIIALPDDKLTSLLINKISTEPCCDPLEKRIQFDAISFKLYFSDEKRQNIKEPELREDKSFPFTLDNFIWLYSEYLQFEEPFLRRGENIDPSKARQLLSDYLSRSEIYNTLWDELRKTDNSAYYYDHGQYFSIQKALWDDKKNYLTLLATGHIKKTNGEGSVPVFITKEIESKFTYAPPLGHLDKLNGEIAQFFNFPPGAPSLPPQAKLYFLYLEKYWGNSDPKHNVDKALRDLIRQHNFILLPTKGRPTQERLKEYLTTKPDGLYITETDLNTIEGLLRPTTRKANKQNKIK